MTRLEEIEARCAAATQGPWQEDTCSVICRCGWSELARRHVDGGYYGVICETGTYDDCQSLPFIAAAREDVPWLLAEVKRLRAALEAIAKDEANFLDHLLVAEKALDASA